MMMMGDEFQYRNNLSHDDIELSLLRLSSPPFSHSSAVSPEISPLKRSSPLSDESDQPKRRKVSLQNPIFIASPLRFTYPETKSSRMHDPTRYPNPAAGQTRCSQGSLVLEKQETTPYASKTCDTERQQEEEEEEDCGEGMRIERSGDGFVIRLKCRCKQAFRVLFSDHHLYFKPL